jgi:glycosyltransferase involved in cell wall biosynthesis
MPLKWIPFLLTSLEIIHRAVPGFRMIIVGDGPEKEQVKRFCAEHSWCVTTGAIHGLDRVPILSLGDVWLNPGMLGLAVLDAFALGVPVITTDNGLHSPEIVYLRNGENGTITQPDPKAFATAVTKLLNNPRNLRAMKNSAAESGRTYTLERMIDHFTTGIFSCLKINTVGDVREGC